MNSTAFFQAVSAACNIPCQRAFWDVSKHGNKPATFFVWRTDGTNTQVNSDNEEEAYSVSFRVSVFTKSQDLESVCEQIAAAAMAFEADAGRLSFEDYEKDTGYHHGEITVKRYF